MNSELVQAFGRTLAETEWLSTEKLRIYQAPLIAKLLRHAQQTTEFYRERFQFNLNSAEEFERNWSKIPIFTRADAVANRDRLMSRFVPPEVGETQQGTTSGSIGLPLPYRRSEIAVVASHALTERLYRWWKVDGRKPFARISFDRQRIAPPPEGATMSGWHTAHPRGLYYALSTAADVEMQVNWLAERKPTYLATYTLDDIYTLNEAAKAAILDKDSYAHSRPFGADRRNNGSDGLVYPSVRHKGGQCVAAFWPDVVSVPIQERHLSYEWDGQRIVRYFDYRSETWLHLI